MKKIFVGVILLSIAIVPWVFLRDAGGSHSKLASAEKSALAPSPFAAERPSIENVKIDTTLRALRPREFAERFGLTQVEELKVRRSLIGLAFALLEERGLATVVKAFDGKRLVLATPPLSGSIEAIAKRAEQVIAGELRSESAAAIMSDPKGRETVMSQLGLEDIFSETIFVFEKFKDESNPEQLGSLGHAKFKVQITHSLNGKSSGMRIEEFDYSQAGNFALAWNSMAKAPIGYFRSEPILGVASRPAPVIIYEDSKSDKVEVRGLQGAGSKHTVDVGPKS